MKTNCRLILGTVLAMSLATPVVAQVNTDKLPEIPPPANTTPGASAPSGAPAETKPAPAKAATTKKKATPPKKTKAPAKPVVKKAPEPLVLLVAGPATVNADHVNLRGQAGLKGEVVGHVQKGETVNVISEINLDKPKAGEPAQWAKISLPSSVKVWVNSRYIDASNSVVSVKKLNLRGGPGENYSVLGVIEKGTAVAAVATKGDWAQIEAPSSAFAFVAASYLKQEAGAVPTSTTMVVEAMPPPSMPPTPTTVPESQPIAPPAATPPPEIASTVTPPPTPVSPPTPEVTPAIIPTPMLEPEDTNLPPPPPRIVTHEGFVRHSVSLVAPTDFELYDPANNKAINYLFSTTTNLNLKRYNGLHITVTGEEGMDPRWKDTPVVTIQKIYVLGGTPAPEKGAEKADEQKPVEQKPVEKKKHWWSF